MGVLLQYFHAIGAFNALLLSVVLFFSGKLNPAGKVLVIWLLAWSIYAVSPLIFINAPASFLSAFHIIALWLPASFGALMYLYLSLSIRRTALLKRDIIKFIPLVMCLLLNADYAFMSEVQLADFRNRGVEFDIQHQIAMVFLYGQAFYYFAKSFRLIVRYKQQTESELSNFQPAVFQGLTVIIGVNLILWLLEILSALYSGVYFLALASDIFFTLFLCFLGLLHWKEPHFFSVTHRQKIPDESHNREHLDPIVSHCVDNHVKRTEGYVDASHFLLDGEKKDDSSALLDETLAEVFQSIDVFMREQQPYLDSKLSLTSLSDQLGLGKHYVSEAINAVSGQNFHQYVNNFRVQWFCKQLKENPSSKLLDLAMDSGFSSKSAFNAVFKKLTGKTPTQYKSLVTPSL
ncbi:helix-turn-helix domain-containing protein [Alteromonas sp. A079]|uniref:helix-turn-helix domain-containing protein n=1 Tax=Alteromonas sp. A079 TaxID=3410268 RepID=UPI003B9FE538